MLFGTAHEVFSIKEIEGKTGTMGRGAAFHHNLKETSTASS